MTKKFYQVLGVHPSASKEEIKTAYKKASIKWHPDKNIGNQEKAKEEMQKITEAYTVLSDEDTYDEKGKLKNGKKYFYDTYGDDVDNRGRKVWEYYYNLQEDENDEEEDCDNRVNGCKNKYKKDTFYRLNDIISKSYFWEEKGYWWKKRDTCFFCSYNCSNEFKNKSLFQCQKCWGTYLKKIEKENSGHCPECFAKKTPNSPPPPKTPKNNKGKVPSPDKNLCPGCDTDKATDWKKGGKRGKYYCQNCWDSLFGGEEYIQKIKSLDKLTEEEKQFYINQINNNQANKFERIWLEAEEENKSRGGRRGGGNLAEEIQKAIQEIENELNREPKITPHKNWRDYIEGSSTLVILESRKQKMLNDIRVIREQQGGEKNQNLTELRTQAINQINQELQQNPPVSSSELENPNWEEEINQAQKNDIINIRDQVLANIRNKRVAKNEVQRLTELLTLAKAEKNWNDYSNLEGILKQIKTLRSSSAYSEKEAEIKAIENRLQKLEPSKFSKTNEDLLAQQIKDNGLTESDLDPETKAAVEEAKKDPTSQKREKAEEAIAVCGASKNLTNILVKVKKVITEKEKEDLINEILTFISKNKYSTKAYQKRKLEVEKALAELRGENQPENTSSDKPPYLAFALLLIGGSAMAAFFTFLIWRKKKKLADRQN